VLVAIVLVGVLGVVAPQSSAAADHTWTVTPVSLGKATQTLKAATSRLAQSDPSLLAETSNAETQIVVKLDYDAVATYAGGVAGLPATSPAATGARINARSKAVGDYTGYVAAKEDQFLGRLAGIVPGARVGTRLRTVYGGVALRVPASSAKRIAALPGVIAVQRDTRNHLLTDASATFLGAPALYNQLAATDRTAGRGVIVGILDSGVWPEHPSFSPVGVPKPPARADGKARPCVFGDNPVTPSNDPFSCNNKLVAGQPFLDAYNASGGAEQYPKSARDGNGHGTHTASTSAGGYVANVRIFDVPRGPIHGIAPGASIAAYKVCGTEGCDGSDSAAAVAQAIDDGVSVINYSISGGSQPLTDVTELAFLDAYQAGVFVAASAGNDGPGASTTEHLSPWVTTVAASTQTRAFTSSLTLKAGTASLTVKGASITKGVATASPVVDAATFPGYENALCDEPAPAGLFSGMIVVCKRGSPAGRVDDGHNVAAGGAAGMILYNPAVADTETDNHFLPAVHLDFPEGKKVVDFLAAHTGSTGTFTDGTKDTAKGDVMAAFSSRGPGGPTIKPDITAPGVQILAGNTPTPDEIAGGPAGQYYQAIAGTSMSSPHIAGSAALMVALHPTWTPGQIKSALMTTATTKVLKEDQTTPADPFDLGSGRVQLAVAGDPGLTFADSGLKLAALYGDPVHAVDMNVPSIDAPVMPGTVTTRRVAHNTTRSRLTFRASTTAPNGAAITVSPSTFTVAPGADVALAVKINGATLAPGQYFGSITLQQVGGNRTLHLPVAFNRQQSQVGVVTACTPPTIKVRTQATSCGVTVANNSYDAAAVAATTTVEGGLGIDSVQGARRAGPNLVQLPGTLLVGKTPATPKVAPGASAGPGYVDLEDQGVEAEPAGDEDLFNLPTDPFTYGGEQFDTLAISSNGYVVPGGGTSEDQSFEAQDLPDPARPNNVLAPYWSDLNGTGAEGIRAATLTDDATGDSWLVVQWDEYLYGTTDGVAAQIWIGLNGKEDLSYSYGGAQPDPGDAGLTVGAENVDGSKGSMVSKAQALSGADLRVTTTGFKPGGQASYKIIVRGQRVGTGVLTTRMQSPQVSGTTVARAKVTVTR